MIRDSLLAVAGVLDPTMFGPGTLDSASRRRSIYFTVKRSKLIPMLHRSSTPPRELPWAASAKRPTTTVAPQLYLMNNPQVRQYAKAFAPPNCIEFEAKFDAANPFRVSYGPRPRSEPHEKRPTRSPSSTRNPSRTSRLAKPTPPARRFSAKRCLLS